MEIGVSLKSLEHVTPRVERNLTGFVRSVSITVGVLEYCYFFGGKLKGFTAGWFDRCTLYTDSKWTGIRLDSDLARLLSAHAGIDALTAENARTLAERV